MKDRFEDRLVAYLEGDLPERERRELDDHLETCQDCRRQAEAGRLLGTLVKELPAPELPEGFMARFGAALDAAQPVRVVNLRSPRVVWSRTLLAAAACLLVLFGVLLLWSRPVAVEPVVAAGPPVVLVASGAPLVNEQRVGKVIGLSENQVVVTDQKATALVVGASSQVELAAGSELRVLKVERNLSSRRIEGELELLRGTAMVAESGARLAVRTPHGLIVPVGTSYEVALDGDATRVQVFSGSVRVERPSGGQDTLDAGWQGVLRSGQSLEKSPLQEVREVPRRPAPMLGGNLDQGQDYPKARPRPGTGADGPRPGMGEDPGGPRPGMGDGPDGPRPGMGEGPGGSRPRPGMGEGPGGPRPRPGMDGGDYPRYRPRPNQGNGPGMEGDQPPGSHPRPSDGNDPGGRPRPNQGNGPGMDGDQPPGYRPRPNQGNGAGMEGGQPPGYRPGPSDGNEPGGRPRPNQGKGPGREGYRPHPGQGNGPGTEGDQQPGYPPRPNGANRPGTMGDQPRPRFEGSHPLQRTPVTRRQAR